jgi:putative protease
MKNFYNEIKTKKTPRIGKEGCCGKGCNGCLIFWHDEKYQKAREILKTKKIGEML